MAKLMRRMEELAIAMRREHAELGHHIGEVRELLSATMLDWAHLVHVLRALDANIARHFAFEETDGYLAEVPDRTPSLEREITDLRGEHGRMRKELRAIREVCEDRDSKRLRDKLEGWLSLLAEHERRENALFLRLLEDETGIAD